MRPLLLIDVVVVVGIVDVLRANTAVGPFGERESSCDCRMTRRLDPHSPLFANANDRARLAKANDRARFSASTK